MGKVIKMIVIEIKIKVRVIWVKERQMMKEKKQVKAVFVVAGGFEEHFSFCSV